MSQYLQRTYHIKPHQLEILNDIKSLPRKRLHYITVQQSDHHPNLTLPEMKKLIKRGLRRYFKETTLEYYRGLENELMKYYCVFETKKDFFLSQHQNNLIEQEIDMGLHFHLFITSLDNYNWVSFPNLIHTLFSELTSIKHKQRCLSEFGYKMIDKLDDNFILYHTKQFMYRTSEEMILKNY